MRFLTIEIEKPNVSHKCKIPEDRLHELIGRIRKKYFGVKLEFGFSTDYTIFVRGRYNG